MQKEEHLLSVIAPMYNCETYVDDFLGALAGQSLDRFEVICVDDGSTDGTLSRIKAFCARDERFRFLSKEHGGAGTARNAGMDVAAGKWLLFPDADDLYHEDYFREMVQAADDQDADLVVCLLQTQKRRSGALGEPFGFNTDVFPDRVAVSADGVEQLYLQICDSPIHKLFRKSVSDRYHLRFSATKTSNDVFFVRAYTAVAKTIVGIHKSLVVYRGGHNPTGISSYRKDHAEDGVAALSDLYSFLQDNDLFERHREGWLQLIVYHFMRPSRLPYREKHIEAFTALLCENPYLKAMDGETFYASIWQQFDPEKIAEELGRISGRPDVSRRKAIRLLCQLRNATAVERLAKEKYQRVLNPYGRFGNYGLL